MGWAAEASSSGEGSQAAPWEADAPLCPQRYLDEAEREKQQYMKELREYQQSEAYKMCTEKIQEKKIKKGASGEQWLLEELSGPGQVLPQPLVLS